MASRGALEDEDVFGADIPGSNEARRSEKRAFGGDDDEDDVFGNKKGKQKVEEREPGATTGMILSLRESLQEYKDKLTTCQSDLESIKVEVQKWCTAFQSEPAVPTGMTPDPGLVLNYMRNLRSSEDSLRDQLEKARKREAALIVTFAKKEQEIADLKSALRELRTQLKPSAIQARRFFLDPAIHEEFTRLKTLNEDKEKKVKELEENAKAVNFTPQSKMGKMLMAKCRTLQEENEEIGAMASEGKIHELAMKLAVQKSQNGELRSQFEALCKQMDGLTNDMERSNEMVFVLQDKLYEKDFEIRRLQEALSTKELQVQTDCYGNGDAKTSDEAAKEEDETKEEEIDVV